LCNRDITNCRQKSSSCVVTIVSSAQAVSPTLRKGRYVTMYTESATGPVLKSDELSLDSEKLFISHIFLNIFQSCKQLLAFRVSYRFLFIFVLSCASLSCVHLSYLICSPSSVLKRNAQQLNFQRRNNFQTKTFTFIH